MAGEKICAKGVIEHLLEHGRKKRLSDDWLCTGRTVGMWLDSQSPSLSKAERAGLVRAIPRWFRSPATTAPSLRHLTLVAQRLEVSADVLLGGPKAATSGLPANQLANHVKSILASLQQVSCYVCLIKESLFDEWHQQAQVLEEKSPQEVATAVAGWARQIGVMGVSAKFKHENRDAPQPTLMRMLDRRLRWIQESDSFDGEKLAEYARRDVVAKLFEIVRNRGETHRSQRMPTMFTDREGNSRVSSLSVSFDQLPGIIDGQRLWLVVYHWGSRLTDGDLADLMLKINGKSLKKKVGPRRLRQRVTSRS